MNLSLYCVAVGIVVSTLTGAANPVEAHERFARAPGKDLPLIAEVAPRAVQISPHVPNMGAHWVDPASPPTGPIYCVVDSRVVCIEYMFDASDLAAGTSWTRLLPGIATPPIERIDVEFRPDGIPPHPVPLYQIHAYFASEAELADH